MYLWDGTKLCAKDSQGNGLVYLGSLVYDKRGDSLTLESASFGEGRIAARQTADGVDYSMLAFQTDHLGSVRGVVDSGEILEHNDYDPFGRRQDAPDAEISDNRYRYNGKEEQAFVGNPYQDYGARMYDSQWRMRWNTMDPMAEKYYSISPYAFCANNPIKFVDPNGAEWAYYSLDGEADPTWNWVDGEEYRTGILREDGTEIVLKAYKAVVVFNGSGSETIGVDGTLTGDDANPAKVTIYGVNGENDIAEYNGLTVSSNPEIYPMIEAGDYKAYQEQMPTSIYARDALSYRVTTINGNKMIPPVGGINKRTGLSYIAGEYFHRTDWNGRATKSSQACLIIDGRFWREVEKQLGKSQNILIRVNR